MASIFSILRVLCVSISVAIATEDLKLNPIQLSKVAAPGCPYTAAWFVQINLFAKMKWWLTTTKMEAATFNVYYTTEHKYQFVDETAYFVHHMSMYEHYNHKFLGFEVAKKKTLEMSKAALTGECSSLKISGNRETIALVPFYGGLPPNVTADLTVKSLGQGNSLVDASTKVVQCMATVCSLLKYFGHVVIGVAREQDKTLVEKMVAELGFNVRSHIDVIFFNTILPAHLPFNLLAWAQIYVQEYNCKGLQRLVQRRSAKRRRRLANNRMPLTNPNQQLSPFQSLLSSAIQTLALTDEQLEVYKICDVNFARHHYGRKQFEVLHHSKSALHMNESELGEFQQLQDRSLATNAEMPINYFKPIKYVYYTECDQVVRFNSEATLAALIAASNNSTFMTGRRREKTHDTDPADYMGGLNPGRHCGEPGYFLDWPRESIVRKKSKVSVMS